MDTKSRGDIAEQAAALHALKRGWNVLKPIGDRLPYDLVFEVDSVFVRVQVKYAWWDAKRSNYVLDVRRSKTNRRIMKRDRYSNLDFDFALAYIEAIDIFYVLPVVEFTAYGSEIHFVESLKRQRKPRSEQFRDAWELITQWAARRESVTRLLSNSGKPYSDGNPEPSLIEEGVET